MKYNILIFLIGSYLLAFSINLIPALKHPDLNIDIINLIVTLAFMVLLLMYSKKGSKKLKVFSLVGIISGLIIFIIKTFEHAMFNNVILDSIAALQYPFYLVFTTPTFGGNILFDLSYAAYSLLMSLFYGVVFVLTIYFKKYKPVSN